MHLFSAALALGAVAAGSAAHPPDSSLESVLPQGMYEFRAVPGASPTQGVAPLTVSFGYVTYGNVPPAGGSWTYGEGSTGPGYGTHTYTSRGRYTATLTARSILGQSSGGSVSIFVRNPGEPLLTLGGLLALEARAGEVASAELLLQNVGEGTLHYQTRITDQQLTDDVNAVVWRLLGYSQVLPQDLNGDGVESVADIVWRNNHPPVITVPAAGAFAGAEQRLPVTINAIGLTPGYHWFDLRITSNTVNSPLIVRIGLRVIQ